MKTILVLVMLSFALISKAQDTVRSPISYVSSSRASNGRLINSTVKVVDGYIVKWGDTWEYMTLTKKPLPNTYSVLHPKKEIDYSFLIADQAALKSQNDSLINVLNQYPVRVIILRGDSVRIN